MKSSVCRGCKERMATCHAECEKYKEEWAENRRQDEVRMKERAAMLTKTLLESTAPLEIVENEIIPALDTVGTGFEAKRLYLPQLLMSAEAAGAAFEAIKSSGLLAANTGAQKEKIEA